MRAWEQEHVLKLYFNCHNSHNLAPFENCRQPVKGHLRKFPHWDDANTKELVYEGWTTVSPKLINEKAEPMPERLQAIKDAEGRMTDCWVQLQTLRIM